MKTRLFLAHLFLLLLSLPARSDAEENVDPAAAAPAAAKEKQYGSVEERRLMESIDDAAVSSAAGERENLESRKKELKRLEEEVDKKLDQLNQLRTATEKLLAEKDAQEQKRVTELAKVYEKMTAEKAAAIIGSLEQDLAIAILGKMKTKSAAKILNNMEREKAAKLTAAFSTLDKQ